MNIYTTTLTMLLLTNHLTLSLILPKTFKSSEKRVVPKDRWLIDVIEPNLIELRPENPATKADGDMEYSSSQSSVNKASREFPPRYLLTFRAEQKAFYGLLYLNSKQPVAIIANDNASDSDDSPKHEPNEFCDLYNGHLFQPYSGLIAATICSNIHNNSDNLILYSTIEVNRDDGSRGSYVIRNHPHHEEDDHGYHQSKRPTIINIDSLNYVIEESNCSFFPNGKITKLNQHHLYTINKNEGNEHKSEFNVKHVGFRSETSEKIIDYIEPRFVAPKIYARTKRDSTKTDNGKVYNIETIIFVDQSLIQRMNGARSELQKLVLAIMNEVQLIYNFDSLKTRIRILIKKIVYLDPTKDAPNTANGDIDQYLDNFCSWQKHLWKRTATDSRWDHALMLTGLDLYKQIGREKNKKVLGLAWVNGMCRPSYSCTLNEGKNFESAFVIAHEMAHSLGMLHDGYDNNCDPDKYIMSEKTGPGKINWSPCSNMYLENFLKKTNLKCLEKTSDESFMFYTSLLDGGSKMRLPGEQYSLNQQCQLALGDDYRAFITQQSPFNDICKELWCLHKNWASPAHPALEGSFCGNGKSCSQGVCTDKHQAQQQSMRAGSKYNSYLNALRQNDETMLAKRRNRNKNRNNPNHNFDDQRFYPDNSDYEAPTKSHNGNINSNGSTSSSGINVEANTFMRSVQRFLRNTLRSITRVFSG